MRKTLIAGAVILVAAAVGITYLGSDSLDESPTSPESKASSRTEGKSVVPTADVQLNSTSGVPDAKPALNDPRLVALAVSQDNGYIEFVTEPGGKVIKEIDKNPTSLGFKKPLREYLYSGNQVVGLTAYQYFGDHVQVIETKVSYKPDGNINQYAESTSYQYPEKKKN
ncbi:MAG: hypothetical protein QM808_02915 [Steroidobacteraceae bacterium]